jgi:hypothetical protein
VAGRREGRPRHQPGSLRDRLLTEEAARLDRCCRPRKARSRHLYQPVERRPNDECA